MVVIVGGVLVAFYASLLLAEEIDRGQSPYPPWRRRVQFGFACGIPVAGLVAMTRATPRSGAIALVVALLSFSGWVLTFFDWGDQSRQRGGVADSASRHTR